MLTNLELKNFRRHTNLEINYTDGINVLRAQNEGGKSTTLEAINYALFGSKVLRTSLDEVVTWGYDVKSLQVKATFNIDGDTITFIRGKSGAEVVKNGQVFVTGQTEVSAFAAQLMGADATQASKLMFASQNGLRGALEEGPKALAQMIEDLASFDTFDRILEAAQDKLVLGSPSVLEATLKGAQETLAAASEGLPEKPDANEHTKMIDTLNRLVGEWKAKIPNLKNAADESAEAFNKASGDFLKRVNMVEYIDKLKERLKLAEAAVAGHKANAGKPLPELDSLKAQIAEDEQYEKRLVDHRRFKSYKPERVFDGTEAEFDTAIDAAMKDERAASDTLARLQRERSTREAARITHDKCDKCGQDVSHLESVKETNAAVDRDIADIDARIAKLTPELEAAQSRLAELQGIGRENRAVKPIIDQLRSSTSVKIFETVFPPRIEWIGEEPGKDHPDLRWAREELAKRQAEITAINSAKAKLELAEEQLASVVTELRNAEAELAEFKGPCADDLLRIEEESKQAAAAYHAANGEVIMLEGDITRLKSEFLSAEKLWSSAQARIEDAQRQIDTCKQNLEDLGFNNALVKKLRTIRPMIADKLWNSVLASVSVMFSQMRGEPSVVTKDKDGFKVNGQVVESLSGSTLDILGLAIRCSLIKTFLPNCNLLILDEPMHGCDDARSEALLGFVAASGFDQVLLVTHEGISESIASNLIQL